MFVRRRPGKAFGDSYAFPGGVLENEDSLAGDFCSGRSAVEADAILGIEHGGLGFFSAAARELFEETGVLLARNSRGERPPAAFETDSVRDELNSGRLSWTDFLRTNRLTIACDELHYFTHWETPLDWPARWSTRFFLAQMPQRQIACVDGNELTESRWLTPQGAVEAARLDGLNIPFPTLKTTERLAEHKTVDSMIGWAEDTGNRGIGMPRTAVIEDDGSLRYAAKHKKSQPPD